MNQYILHILHHLFFIFCFFSWPYQIFLFLLFLSPSLPHWQRCAENVYSGQRLQIGFNAETSIGKRILCLYIQEHFSTYSYPYFPIYLFSVVHKISATLISPRLCFIFLILSCYFSLPFSLTVSICFFFIISTSTVSIVTFSIAIFPFLFFCLLFLQLLLSVTFTLVFCSSICRDAY